MGNRQDLDSSYAVTVAQARERAQLWPFWVSITGALAAGVSVTGIILMAVMLAIGGPGVQQVSEVSRADLIDILRFAFFGTAGIGGAIALLIAYRRQRVAEAAHDLTAEFHNFDLRMKESSYALQERVAADGRSDASEKRITELYASAAQQLGSDRAALRLAGIYALERLAQDNPGFRQTIVDLLCAYLRLPFRPRGFLVTRTDSRTKEELDKAVEDAHVRLAVQTMLHRHLIPAGIDLGGVDDVEIGSISLSSKVMRSYGFGRLGADSERDDMYWPGIHLDLSNATLLDFSLRGARVASVNFSNARFASNAEFSGLVVERECSFVCARFYGAAIFQGASFLGGVHFYRSRFEAAALFSKVIMRSFANFVDASFRAVAQFMDAEIECGEFDGATFRGKVSFERAVLSKVEFGIAAFWFESCRRMGPQFRSECNFSEVKFSGRVGFVKAYFRERPKFSGATYSGDGWRRWPVGLVELQTGEIVPESVLHPMSSARV